MVDWDYFKVTYTFKIITKNDKILFGLSKNVYTGITFLAK